MDSYSFKYFLNTSKSKSENIKIYGRLIIDRKKAEFYTRLNIKESEWNPATNMPKKQNGIYEDLSNYHSEILEIKRNFIALGKTPSAKEIVNKLTKRDSKITKNRILDYYQYQVNKMEVKADLNVATIKHYKSTKKTLMLFLESMNKTTLSLAEVDEEVLEKYDTYMKVDYKGHNDQKITRNTINKHHSRFRAILSLAVKDKIIKLNPYFSFKRPSNTKSTRTFLSVDEMKKLKEADLGGNQSLEKIRDIFLFSCQTGLRFGDALSLKMSDIKNNKSGKSYIEDIAQKNDENIILPLTKDAMAIINKYGEHNDRKVGNHVLPQLSNQKFNTYIKIIGNIAGIEKTLTHHVARHTFATNALNNGIPLEVVKELLAQSNIKTTQIYAKLTNKTKFEQMEKME
jgi:site-specific recombinase XerD